MHLTDTIPYFANSKPILKDTDFPFHLFLNEKIMQLRSPVKAPRIICFIISEVSNVNWQVGFWTKQKGDLTVRETHMYQVDNRHILPPTSHFQEHKLIPICKDIFQPPFVVKLIDSVYPNF